MSTKAKDKEKEKFKERDLKREVLAFT